MILELKKTPRNQRDYADVSKWPQTSQVFDAPTLDFSGHQWIQRGYELIDSCPACPKQGIPIPAGKMLIREDGKYSIVDELRN